MPVILQSPDGYYNHQGKKKTTKESRIEELERIINVYSDNKHDLEVEILKWHKKHCKKKIKSKVGMLRQWLNERTDSKLLTNKDLETWLID